MTGKTTNNPLLAIDFTAFLTQSRSVCGVQPILAAIAYSRKGLFRAAASGK